MQDISGTIEEFNISNDQLDLILNKHPYFQLGQIEKSIRLRNENHIDALKTVRKCAILIPERSLLYSHFHISENKKETALKEDEEINESDSIIEEKQIPDAEIEIADSTNEGIKAPPKIDNKDIDVPKEDNTAFSDILEKEYIVEAVNQSIQAEALDFDSENITIEDKTEKEDKIEKKESILSFSEWLDGGFFPQEEKIQNDLIDKFIQESPQIQRLNDQSFYSAFEKGKESISDESLPYSETLASIFVQQGNKILAIKAYKYLMLKNPQKSVYFADLIKKLEE